MYWLRASSKAPAETRSSTIAGSRNTNHIKSTYESLSKGTSNYKQCSLQGRHKVLK